MSSKRVACNVATLTLFTALASCAPDAGFAPTPTPDTAPIDAGASATADATIPADSVRMVDLAPADTRAISNPGDVAAPNPVAGRPADFLDLTNWKITLPDATEIKQPALATFSKVPTFYLDPRGFVNFRAEAGGSGSTNSSYPRSELREMTDGGKSDARWSTSIGVHTLTITQAITHTLVVKPHVVAGQIHDASDDLVMVRLEGTRLFVENKGNELSPDLDPRYILGTKFVVRIEASRAQVRVYYNDLATAKVILDADVSGCYFKAGVYTQSNSSKGEDPTSYGEVRVFQLQATHAP